MTDFELLHEYAARSSEEAFGTLVDRYAGLVYSAALRQTRNPPEAEEITQVVFVILARKAAGIRKNVIIPGWLLRTTRFVALNAIRREKHRRQTEQQAVSLFSKIDTDVAWKRIAPILDEALVSLGEKDRNAVVLRYLERKSFKELAELLCTSEDGAQKRVTRALGKIRTYFVKNGVVLSTTVVATALSTRVVQAAPAGLSATIATSVLSSASTPSLASIAMADLDRARVKELALQLCIVTVLLVLALLAVREFTSERIARPALPNSEPTLALGANPPPPTPPSDSASPPGPGQILLRVLDSQTDSPVRNAKLTVVWDTGFPNILTNMLSTDQHGESLLSFPLTFEERWNLRIEIIKDGYVPRFVSWAAGRGDLLEDIPVRYITRLGSGTVVAGLVMNEDGEPVPDTQIGVGGPGPTTGPEAPAEREGLAISHIESTDARGRWFCNHLPSQLQPVTFSLAHREYVSANFRPAKLGAAQLGPSLVAEDELRYGTAVMVLKRGRIAVGIVTDEQGQPINGVRLTRDRLYWDPAATTLTDADGHFSFANIPAGEDLILTAQADGFLPADVTLSRSAPSDAVRLVVQKAAVLRGRVLDPKAHPIARASVLPTSGDYGSDRFYWSTLTDAQGRFEWLSAPAMPMQYQIAASSYENLRVDLPADGVEHTITLQKAVRPPAVRIAGRAIDSRMRQPISKFQVWTAVTLSRKSPSGFQSYKRLARKLTTTSENGDFAFLAPTYYAEPIDKLDIEVRADGYLTAHRTLASPLTNYSQIGFELTPVGGLTGSVQLSDGVPASGAVVVVCAANEALSQPYHVEPCVCISLPGEFDRRSSSQNRSETDTDGTFTLKTKPPAGMLFVAHKLGYAEAPLDRLLPSAVIQLNPWGSVSGTLRIGKAVGTNRTVFLGKPLGNQAQFVSLALTAATDDSGHFTIQGVPPGEWRLLPHGVRIKVQAGERTEVVVGGGGLRVQGKITPADASHRLTEEGRSLVLSSRLFDQAIPSPKQFPSLNDYLAAKTTWFRSNLAYLQTEVGREALRTSRNYTPVVQPDGTFTIDEVLPGEYELKLDPNPLRPDPPRPLLDEVIQEVVVPVPTEVTSDTLDLGIVDLHLATPIGPSR